MTYRADEPTWDGRDRFILSKGHGVLGFFPALVEAGILSEEKFNTFKKDESDLIAHPVMNLSLGIESSNGSLGQGLSMGVGLALAAIRKKASHRVYVLLGDGECNEGMVWESAMCGAHYRLSNLTAIVDRNGFQSDGESAKVMNEESLSDKWRSFGWDVRDVDGHNVAALLDAFRTPTDGRPKAIIARTIKGKGVKFMENNNEWHHNRLTKASYEQAVAELEAVANA
jgi:transketolase